MRADLHVHSKYSLRPSQWFLQKIGCPESFTEPIDLYRIARNRGMSLVTITDHNSIDGALEIAHLPNTFISEEVTSYFPEDQCKLHVLVYQISESQHEDIQKLLSNLYSIAYQFYRSKLGLGNYAPSDGTLKFIDRCLRTDLEAHSGLLKKLHILRQYRRQKKIATSAPNTMMELLRRETCKLLTENPQLFLIPEGAGPHYPEIEQRWFKFVKEISNRVLLQFADHLLDHFSGYLKGDDLATVYASCDIFIYPSTMDSFGRAVLEAQASGLPVIVTDRGGPQENIVAGKTGLSVKGDDADSIVDALHFLIANPTAAREMSRAARQYMEERFFDGAFHHSWKMYAAAPDDEHNLSSDYQTGIIIRYSHSGIQYT